MSFISNSRSYQTCFTLLIGLVPGLFVSVPAAGQDTSRKKNVEITSTFKPLLREVSKITFAAAPPVRDTSRPRVQYVIPGQNLLFDFQPASLTPVAMHLDTSQAWQHSNVVKLGWGNFHQPFFKAGFSFGDRVNSYYNVFAEHYSAKGKLPFQQNSLTRFGGAITYLNQHHQEWNGKIDYTNQVYYRYGFEPDSLRFSKDELRQNFQTVQARLHFRNTQPSSLGFLYHPSLHVSYFSDGRSARESNSVLEAPLTKNIGRLFAFQLSATADLTHYQRPVSGKSAVQQNNLFYFAPAFQVKSDRFFLQTGVRPAWDNTQFYLLPNILADITTSDQRFTFQLGWIGSFQKGSYQRFAGLNPWLAQTDTLVNTRIEERFAGFKGSVEKHFFYSAKVSLQRWHQTPLFVNDVGDGKTFELLYEPRMDVVQLHGELEYRQGESVIVHTALTINQFTNLQKEKKPWGMIPIEWKTGIRWKITNDFSLHADLWTWSGPQYRGRDLDHYKAKGGADLSSGVDFAITPKFKVWLQLNNLLNNRYERWHQYPVYGFHFLGGITYLFPQPR